MPRRNMAWMLIAPALVLLGLAISFSAPAPDKDYLLIKQIVEVLAKVDSEYVRELNDKDREQLIEDMIDGGLRKLDEHSEYMNLDRAKAFATNTEGSFGGIGVTITVDPKLNMLKIESPMPGTPAYEAGIASGDLILKVDGHSTEGMRVDEARKLITGEIGTPVTLTTLREGRVPLEEDVVVKRAKIDVHPVTGVKRKADDPTKWDYMLDPKEGIGYVRLSQFTAVATSELEAALKQIHAEGGKALVLDLRDDPGGLLPQAISVADLFLPGGRIVSTKNRRGTEQEFTAKPAEKGLEFAEQWPIAVLVNRNSASASEIVSAALQDHGRAVVVGERSFGKGSVQKVYNLPGPPTASLKLTTETYWRPSGKNIHRDPRTAKDSDEWGVKPDPGYEVATTDEDRIRWIRHLREVEFVTGKPGTPAPKKPEAKDAKKDEKPFEDKVLQKAEEYLKKKLAGVGVGPAPLFLDEPVRA